MFCSAVHPQLITKGLGFKGTTLLFNDLKGLYRYMIPLQCLTTVAQGCYMTQTRTELRSSRAVTFIPGLRMFECRGSYN